MFYQYLAKTRLIEQFLMQNNMGDVQVAYSGQAHEIYGVLKGKDYKSIVPQLRQLLDGVYERRPKLIKIEVEFHHQ
jgi:hypothetical protein